MINIDKFTEFMNSDWKQMIINKWNSISPLCKKSFIWIFCIINLVFLWHTITFYWGNHDWGQIKYGVHAGWSLWDGRWGAGLIQQIVFGGDILPVWNNLFCFAGFTFAVIYLAKYWEVPKNTFTYVIFGLFIILLPYTMPWLQYVRSETHFWNIFLIVIALMISSNKKLWASILSVLLLLFCMGCYVGMFPAILTIFLGRCILDVWFDNKTLKELISDRKQTIFIIFIAFSVFCINFVLMKHFHIIIPMTTVDNVGIITFFHNFISLEKGIMNAFFYPLSYMPTGYKVFIGTAIPIVLWLMRKNTENRNILLVVLFYLLFVSTQATDLLSHDDYSKILRIDFFSMPYVYALFWTILLRTGKVFENIAILFMCISIFYSSLQDIRDQKVKYFDKIRDIRIFEDVIGRIKSNPSFNPDIKYKLYIVGEVEKNYVITTFDIYNPRVEWSNAWAPLIPNWNAKEYFDFYEKKSYVKYTYTDYSVPLTDNVLREMDWDYLLNRAAPYPSTNSTYINDGFIYIIFQQQELDEIRERIKKIEASN